MIRRAIVFTIMCGFLTPFIAAGADHEGGQPVVIDEPAAVFRALAADETLQIRTNEAAKNHQYYRQVKSVIYPQVSGTLGITRNLDYPSDTFGSMKDYEAGAGVQVSQLLWSFGKVAAAIQAADSALQGSEFIRQSSRQDVILSAKQSYYTALLAQETLAVVTDSHENARRNRQLLRERSRGGRPAKRDLIKIDADIAARVPLVGQARAQQSAALANLKSRLGIPLEQPVTLRGDFPTVFSELDHSRLEQKLLDEGPGLKALDQAVLFREHVARAQQGAFYPEIAGFASWQKQGASQEWPVGRRDFDDYSLVGVKMSVPLWTGGRTQAQVAQARIDAKNARLERQKAGKELRVALFAAIEEFREQLTTLQAQDAALVLAEESFALTRDLFGSGQVTAADLNDAELLLTGQRLARTQTLYALAMIRARIAQLTNSGEEGL